MLKKIAAFISICVFIISPAYWNFGFWETERDTIIELFWEESWSQIIEKITSSVENIGEKEGNLIKVLKKVSERNNTLLEKEQKSIQDEKRNAVFSYILEHWHSIYKKNFWEQETSLTKEEKNKSEESVLKLQNYLLQDIEDSSFDTSKWVELKGNFLSDIRINWNYFGNIKGSFNLQDIVAQIKWNDLETNGKIKVSLTSSGETENFESDIAVVQKDGNQFIKIENLKSEGNETSFSQDMLAYLKKVEEQKSFVKITWARDDFSEILENIQSVTPTILSQMKQEALFTAYKKIGSVYILVPSKFMCNLGKELIQWNKELCSENEYKDFLATFLNANIFLSLERSGGNDVYSIFWYENSTHIYGKLEIGNMWIEQFQLDIIPSLREYKNQGIHLRYNGKDTFDIKLKIEEINFWARLKWDIKNYRGEYAFSSYAMWVIKWTLEQSLESDKHRFFLDFEGKDIWGIWDDLSWKIDTTLSRQNKLLFDITASYKQWWKEIIWGNINYQVEVFEKDIEEIKIPDVWVTEETLESDY